MNNNDEEDREIETESDFEDIENSSTSFTELLEEYGLEHDCPTFIGLSDYVRFVAGSTIAAARAVINGQVDIAIHWDGGRLLRRKFDKVLYIDLDLHHSDGVESAFLYTDKVMTISFHNYARGFYPGSGALTDIGQGKGLYHTVNVPLRRGLRGARFLQITEHVLGHAYNTFQPDAIVVQCGCDGLTGDPAREWNLDIQSFGQCVRGIASWNKPTIFLGGGGYNHANVARCNAYMTSLLIDGGISIQEDIPEHQYFEEYGPDFSLFVDAGNRPDLNDDEYLTDVMDVILGYFKNIEKRNTRH
ncbi:8520_t:CDS:2 [Ambispora gerdemannii]|uniref:histone deacetylase n=1 Tax=Ambispora gerdemannii TaxID=144530 RepID=A0A9N8YWA9_9GLOM|nr:8520_t:CDS:2 [Ambispora gerdemannii]